ncbi:MAG: hypothetical protein CNE95_06240 [Puniceicoccaceae bacterium MED-G30]|nr:MAG: hypothetical protein CNE95_06240 [Puniceicoccaceae bacterium MED-G30]RPG87238.1 MAG: hypothetical protein CBC33_000850 [Coraliomargarita sp. TMED73]|tara:strand:+ start:3954 stop:4496 length:543 start_codon:yes stop_codon:yes gene_type:complete
MQNALPELPVGPDLENLRGPLEATNNIPWPLLLALLFLVVICIGLLGWWIHAQRKKSKRRPKKSPFAAAEQLLLEAKKSTDEGHFAQCTTEAIRTCLKAVLREAGSATTAELNEQIKKDTQLNASRIHLILQTCDELKFSEQADPHKERSQLLNTAGQIIDEVRTAASAASAASERKAQT